MKYLFLGLLFGCGAGGAIIPDPIDIPEEYLTPIRTGVFEGSADSAKATLQCKQYLRLSDFRLSEDEPHICEFADINGKVVVILPVDDLNTIGERMRMLMRIINDRTN